MLKTDTRSFGSWICFLPQVETVPSSEISVNFHKAIRRHISENNILYNYLSENLSSNIIIYYLKCVFSWDVRIVLWHIYTNVSGEFFASIFKVVPFGIGLYIVVIVVNWELWFITKILRITVFLDFAHCLVCSEHISIPDDGQSPKSSNPESSILHCQACLESTIRILSKGPNWLGATYLRTRQTQMLKPVFHIKWQKA
jgi:hypothetical protein